MEAGKDSPPIAILSQLLDKFKKKPELSSRMPEVQNTARIRAREKKAEEIKKAAESKQGIIGTEPKATPDVIQDAYKAKLVQKGVPLSIEEKLSIIEHQIPAEKVEILKNQFDRLKEVIKQYPKVPDARIQIEDLVKNIPASVYADKDMADIAREMKQIAYNHIMQHRSYMIDMTIDERVKMGELFKDVKAHRTHEDEAYLQQLGETILSPGVEPTLKEDIQIAHDLVKHLNEKGNVDIDAVMKTVRTPRIVDADIARRKIEKGPKWLQDAANEAQNNIYALSSLAELADANVLQPNLVAEPASLDKDYLFMKGVQVRVGGADYYLGQQVPDQVGYQETWKIRDAIQGQLDVAAESSGDFLSHKEHMGYLKGSEIGMKGAGPAGPEFGQDLIDKLTDLENTQGFSEQEKREARNLKAAVEKYNRDIAAATSQEAKDTAAYKLFEAVDYDQQSSWNRFILSDADLADKFDDIRETAQKVSRERYNEKDLERGWSSLYLSFELMRQSWVSPDQILQRMNDTVAPEIRRGVYTSSMQEANKRNMEQLIQYIANEDYRTHRRNYLRDVRNWDEITAVSGQDIRVVGVEGHKWYQEVNDPEKYKEFYLNLSDQIRATDSLQQIYVGMQQDIEPEKLRGLFMNFGDAGYPRILNKRNGLNMRIFELFKVQGNNILFDEHGNIRSLNAVVMEQFENEIIEQILSQKDSYKKFFNEWDGSIAMDDKGRVKLSDDKKVIRREFNRTEIEAAVNEVSFLFTVTGQRAQVFCNAETPLSMRHQLGNSNEFAAQPADGKIIQAMAPFRWLIERWGVHSAFGKLVMRKMFEVEAARTGIDKYWDARLKGLKNSDPEFKRLAKYAFNITFDPDDHHHHDDLQKILSVCDLEHDSKGWKKWIFGDKGGAPRHHTPHSLKDLTVEDLRAQLIWRDGMRVLDARFSGAYHIIDSGWQIGSQVDALKSFGIYTDSNGVLLHEVARLDVGAAMDVAGDTKGLKKAVEDLRDVTFVKMAKFDPISSFEALKSKVDIGAKKWFEKHAASFNIFHDPGMGETQQITADRPDLFIKSVSIRKTMIDTELAAHKVMLPDGTLKVAPLGPIDYSQDISKFSAEEISAIKWVLETTNVLDVDGNADVSGFLGVMKELSDFAMNPNTRADLSDPTVATYFSTVRKIDPRVQYLDSKQLFKKDHPNAVNWSSLVSATTGGHAAGGGFVRWVGDTGNSVGAETEHLQPLIEAKDTKTFLMHLEPYIKRVLYSGGHSSTRAPVAQSLWLGWSQAVVRDLPADMFGLGGHNSTIPSSAGQRAAGLGAPSLERTEIDHAAHDVEMAVGTVFHADMPDFTEKMEKKFGLALYIGKLRIPMIRLYNAWAFGLIGGAILALGFYESAKKGVSDTSGGGGGGGAPHGGGHH